MLKEYPSYRDLTSRLLRPIDGGVEADIKNFLGRPIQVASGDFLTSDTPGGIITSFSSPDGILTSSPMYFQKIQGFLGFRYKLVLRLQVNAQRFQQGRYMMRYLPQAQYSQIQVATRLHNLAAITQLPGVDIDLASDQDVAFSVPYVSPSLFYNVLTGSGKSGIVYVICYSPLVTPTGSTAADWTMWAHFEDVKLFYPTMTVATPQAGGSRSTKETTTQSGIISRTVAKIAEVADIIKEVPFLSSFAGPTAWGLKCASKAIAIFGFSKPKLVSDMVRVVNRPFFGSNNVDGLMEANSLALNSDPAVANMSGWAGTDEDQMSLPFLNTVAAWRGTYTWSTSGAVGSIIYADVVNPLVCYQTSQVSGANTYERKWLPPCGYLASFHKWWRGDLSLIIKIVKTEFHSGRLGVVFVPGATSGTVFSLALTQYCEKQILDLRTSNRFVVTIPYVANTPWTDTSDSTGVVYVYVVNALVAPATVSSSVSVIIERGGGEDFRVAFPTKSIFTPTMVSSTPKPMGQLENPLDGIELDNIASVQALTTGETNDKHVNRETNLESLDGLVHGGLFSAAETCIGELMFSARSFIKRMCPYYYAERSGAPSGILIRAGVLSPTTVSISGIVLDKSSVYCDWYLTIALMYAYRRGGIRLLSYDNVGRVEPFRTTLQHDNTFTGQVIDFGLPQTWNAANVTLANITTAIGPIVEAPMYSKSFCFYNNFAYDGWTGEPDYFNDTKVVGITFDTLGSAKVSVHRGAADDTDFGFFLGAPPISHIFVTATGVSLIDGIKY